MKMVSRPFVAVARVVYGTASVSDEALGSACGMAYGAMGTLVVVLGVAAFGR